MHTTYLSQINKKNLQNFIPFECFLCFTGIGQSSTTSFLLIILCFMAKLIFKKDYKNLGHRNKAPLPNRGIYASNDINLPRFLHFVNVE